MFHIRCGDDILGKLQSAGLPGAFTRWADPLCQGPTPAGVRGEAWRAIRAKFIVDHYEVPPSEAETFLKDQDDALERFRDHEEVVLWFEHDLFDQIILIYLLDWFRRQPRGRTKVSLICIDQFPGVERFTGLGNLDAEDVISLFPAREAVSPEQFETARRAWAAYTAPDPTGVVTLMEEDTSALPFLRNALRRHLQQFPSEENGLNLTERLALQAIERGARDPEEVFGQVQAREDHPWCGDTMFWWYLRELGTGDAPLVHLANLEPRDGRLPNAVLSTTFDGSDVLNGARDWLDLRPMDRWLGGVHVKGRQIWRWDERRSVLVRR